jgi:hypothetical protein
VSDSVYLSNKAQKITVGEEFKIFSCVDKNNEMYVYGATLGTEGEYTALIEDMYGNVVTFTLILDFTPPEFLLENVADNLSNKDVTVRIDDADAVVYETTSNFVNTKGIIENGKIYDAEGTYYFKATDKAGNVSTAWFTIDKHVAYSATVANGLITASAATVKFSEEVKETVTLNGADTATDTRYSAPGMYLITAIDNAGNVLTLTFEILPSRVRELTFYTPDGFSLTRVSKGAEAIELQSGALVLTDSGKYNLTLKDNSTGTFYSFDITVDNTPPEVTIIEKSGAYSFTHLTKENVTAALYKDGVLVEDFRITQSVKDKGNYLLILMDDLGNENSYTFEIKSTLNTFSIILIVLAALGLIAGAVFVIRGRFFKVF